MTTTMRFSSSDLELMPDDGKRYEVIDGELYVTKQPSWEHQLVSSRILGLLSSWSDRSGAGVANVAPGVVFAEDDDVAPDIVWVSSSRLKRILGKDSHLHGPPELV